MRADSVRSAVSVTCTLLVVVALAGSSVALDPMRARYYETGPQQSRTIECSRSSVTLGAESRIAIRCTRGLLHARILRGVASFTVADDPSKSVLVFSGTATISDSGSTFSVQRESDRSSIKVTRGRVQLSVEQPGPFGTPGIVWQGERAEVFDAGTRANAGGTIVLITPEGRSRPSAGRHDARG